MIEVYIALAYMMTIKLYQKQNFLKLAYQMIVLYGVRKKKLTGFGLDLVVLESKENIVLCVELRDFADILVESEDDKKGKDLEVKVTISVSWISFVICDDSG